MNKLILILLCLLSAQCALAQDTYDELTTINNKTEELTKTLLASGCTTIVTWYEGNAGCPASGPATAIIYWERGNKAYAAVLNRRHFRNDGRMMRHIYDYCIALPAHYPLSWSDSEYASITSDTICNKVCHNIYVFNYVFERMHIVQPARDITFSFDSECRETYSNSSPGIKFTNNFLEYIMKQPLLKKDLSSNY